MYNNITYIDERLMFRHYRGHYCLLLSNFWSENGDT